MAQANETQPEERQPEMPGPEEPAAAHDAGIPDDGDDDRLDVEADGLLAELAESQEEVQRMLAMQRDQAAELGGLKEQLAAELAQLQDEAWRLQAFNELEVLKRQLEALNNLEADLDAAEAVLDAGDQDPAAGPNDDASPPLVNDVAATKGLTGEVDYDLSDDDDDDDDDGVEYNAADVEALQAKLDKELEDMFSQLQMVRNEAASVSARKAQLESELKSLLNMQLTDEDLEREIMAKEELASKGLLPDEATGDKEGLIGTVVAGVPAS